MNMTATFNGVEEKLSLTTGDLSNYSSQINVNNQPINQSVTDIWWFIMKSMLDVKRARLCLVKY